ncbi:MAG: class I SAM-dependent methyltransferase [Alphaproteobacteria bacterium]|nr:class I SAM-dependent methyltransferase [Alphaproteobacteria bacterium]
MKTRSAVGLPIVRRWADSLPRGAAVVDVGCGSGEPMTRALLERGLAVSAIDASPTLAAAFRRSFPDVPLACEPAERSAFFDRRFAGALAVGLLFLLPEEGQRRLLRRIGGALEPEGSLLFSAPRQICSWEDRLTDRASRSLGAEAYARILAEGGLDLVGEHSDEGGNHYFEARKRRAAG